MRLFVATEIPEAQKDSIARAIAGWNPDAAVVRKTARASWHATLKFLGYVPEQRLAEAEQIVGAAAAAAPSVVTRLTNFGAFPTPRRARVLWVGLEDAGHALGSLAARMQARFDDAGFRREKRNLTPHVTLARFRRPTAVDLSSLGALDASQFGIGEVVLFQSILSRQGARYEVLARFPLQ